MGELVEVAFVGDEYEGAVIQALLAENAIPSLQQRVGVDGGMLGYGVLIGAGSRQVMVHAHRAEEARAVLAEAEVEDAADPPEPVNAKYLEDARGGRKLRDYGPIGAYARAFLVAFGAMALVLGVWLLLLATGLI
jgi:hypothetical protein